MFKSKKPVDIKCYSQREVGLLINWLRKDYGLSQINRQEFSVTAVMAHTLWDRPEKVLYFKVQVPRYRYDQLREEFIKTQSFERIFDQILDRQETPEE